MIEHERTGPVDRLNWTISRVAMWIPAFIVAIMFYEVVMRYVFVRPTLWVNEMSLWLAGLVYVTAGLYAMQQRSHIRIFILYDIAPLWLRRIFDILSALCVLIFVFAVIWGGFGEAAAKFWRWETFGTAFDPPIPATNKPVILITLLVLALQVLSNLIRDWPSNPAVRKIFDVAAALLITGLALWALYLIAVASDLKAPSSWQIAMQLVLLACITLSMFGLVRDWNRVPVPFHKDHDPSAEIDLPESLRRDARGPADAPGNPGDGKS